MKRSPIPSRRKKPRRVSVDRNPEYLEFLRDHLCMIRSDPHDNTFGFQFAEAAHGPVNGMGSKGPDSGAIPLCRRHHLEQHRIGWAAFEQKYSIDREKEAAAHYALYALYLAWKELRCAD